MSLDLTLDRHILADYAVWQEKNFREAIGHAVFSLRRTVENIERILAEPIKLGEFSVDTPAGKASNVVNEISTGFYNAGLQRILQTAADLELTLQAQASLAVLKQKQTAQVQRALDGAEDDGKRERDAREQTDKAARAEKRRTQCQAGVWGIGRHGQCVKRATAVLIVSGKAMRVCGTHARARNVSRASPLDDASLPG